MKTDKGRLIALSIATFVWCLFLSSYSVRAQSSGEASISTEQTIDPNVSTIFLGEKEDDPHESFHKPSAIKIDGEGNIYVLDQGNRRIVKFDAAGAFVREIGGAGTGPGEFSNPIDLTLDKEGNIYVVDLPRGRSNKLVIIGRNGEHLNSFDIGTTYKLCGSRIAVNDQGLIYLNLPLEGTLFSVFTKEGRKVASFGEVTQYETMIENVISESTAGNLLFNSVLFCLDNRGFVNTLDLTRPILRQYDTNHNLVFEKEIKSPEIAKITSNLERSLQRQGIKREEIVEGTVSSFMPYFEDVALTPEGDILVLLTTWSRFHLINLEGNLKRRIKPVPMGQYEPKRAFVRRMTIDTEGNVYAMNIINGLVFKYHEFLRQ